MFHSSFAFYQPVPRHTLRPAAFLIAAAFLPLAAQAQIIFKPGNKVAFLGDSITAQGWTSPHGYVKLVVSGLQDSGVKIVPIPAGVGGNRSNDMLGRLQRDVIDKKPDWVTVSCGMNDVIHGEKGIPLDQFKANMTSIVDHCQAAGIKVIVLTTTTYGNAENPNATKLEEYSAFLRGLASEKKCLLVNLNPAFVEAVKKSDPMHGLTGDGVHMTSEGNILLAKTILKAVGCTEPQISKANEHWLDIPNAGNLDARVDVEMNKKYFRVASQLTLRQRAKLMEAAKAAGKPTLMHWSKDLLSSLMKKMVKPAGPYDSLDALFDPANKDKVQAELQAEFEAEIARLAKAGN